MHWKGEKRRCIFCSCLQRKSLLSDWISGRVFLSSLADSKLISSSFSFCLSIPPGLPALSLALLRMPPNGDPARLQPPDRNPRGWRRSQRASVKRTPVDNSHMVPNTHMMHVRHQRWRWQQNRQQHFSCNNWEVLAGACLPLLPE